MVCAKRPLTLEALITLLISS